MEFEYITGVLGAPENSEIAEKIFAEAGNPVANQAKGMSRYRLTDGSHIIVTYRRICHITRKHSSPLENISADLPMPILPPVSQKTCRNCGGPFIPATRGQDCCSSNCRVQMRVFNCDTSTPDDAGVEDLAFLDREQYS